MWRGDLLTNLSRIEANAKRGALRGVTLAAEHVLAEATKLVPIQEGTLSRSGQTSAEMQGDEAVAAISYNTPYAAAQHERLDYRHDQGRRAKYLESPLTAEAKAAGQIMATAVREAMR